MKLCCNSSQLSDYRSLIEPILYTQKNQYTVSDHCFISKVLIKILHGVSPRISKQPSIGCCMVFPTLYIEQTIIMYEVSRKSHFPSCDSNYNAADKFSLVVNCHRVLNNNSYILRLRFRSRSRWANIWRLIWCWPRRWSGCHSIYSGSRDIIAYGTFYWRCAIRIHQSCPALAAVHMSYIIHWSNKIDCVATWTPYGVCTASIHQQSSTTTTYKLSHLQSCNNQVKRTSTNYKSHNGICKPFVNLFLSCKAAEELHWKQRR